MPGPFSRLSDLGYQRRLGRSHLSRRRGIADLPGLRGEQRLRIGGLVGGNCRREGRGSGKPAGRKAGLLFGSACALSIRRRCWRRMQPRCWEGLMGLQRVGLRHRLLTFERRGRLGYGMRVERVVGSLARPRLATGVLFLRWRRLDRAGFLRGMVDCLAFRSVLPRRSRVDGRLDLLCGFLYSVVQCWQDESLSNLRLLTLDNAP